MIRRPHPNAGPPDGYANRAMSWDEALNIAQRVGQIASDQDEQGRPISRTTRVTLSRCGRGYNIDLPAEHFARLCDLGLGQVAALFVEAPRRPICEIDPRTIFEDGQ